MLVSDLAKGMDLAGPEARDVAQSQGVAEALAQYLTPEGSSGDLWPSIERWSASRTRPAWSISPGASALCA